jgi:hypothetical protein
MLVIVKERGDIDKKLGILKISDDGRKVEIVKHPVFKEGETYHISTLQHLITSIRKD